MGDKRHAGERRVGITDYFSNQSLSVDVVCDIVSNEYRRAILNSLSTYGEPLTGEPMSVEDIAKAIAAKEGDPDSDASDERFKRIYMVLYHVHIPKLAEWGIVDYDPDRDVVRPTKRASLIKTHFESVLKAFDVEANYEEERNEVRSRGRTRISF